MKTYKLKDIISQGTKDLFYIWWQELKAVVEDQGVLIFFILVPLGYPLLYTFIYTNETVREVPAAVVDNNRSSLSRMECIMNTMFMTMRIKGILFHKDTW
jgi:ABC-2 type transport system permease protein